MSVAANYQQRIERALAKIEQGAHAGAWPDLSQLAEAAAMSEFHFHRIYRLMTGETPQQTLSRARIGGSLPELKGPDGIMGATGASAYATSQSYARALKSLTGATASQLRADPQLFEEVTEALMKPASGQGAIAIEITQLSPLKLVASRAVGDYTDLNYGFHHLFELVMEQVPPDAITGLYGIPHDDPRDVPAEACRFDCAVTTSAPVETKGELKSINIGSVDAISLRHRGDYDLLHEALDQLYRVAIALDLELADNLPLHHYHDDPDDKAEEELVSEVHLILKEA